MSARIHKGADVYRGLLAQYVIIAHVIPTVFPGVLGIPGTLAVWGFFITSGYLNYLSLERNSAPFSYFKRRVKRLYPLLFISFLVVASFEGTFFIPDIYTLIPAIFWVKGDMPYNSVLWTLIVELQLYLLSPIFFFFLKGGKIESYAFLALMVVMPIVSIVMSYVASKAWTGSTIFDDRTVLSAIPMYIFGMLLARMDFDKEEKYFSYIQHFLLIGSVGLFLWVVLTRNSDVGWWQHLFLEGRFIPFLLTFYLFCNPRIFDRFQERGLFTWLGRMTYEIYLFHGLFAYIGFKLVPNSNVFEVLLFLWVLPLLTAFIYDKSQKYVLGFLKKQTQ